MKHGEQVVSLNQELSILIQQKQQVISVKIYHRMNQPY